MSLTVYLVKYMTFDEPEIKDRTLLLFIIPNLYGALFKFVQKRLTKYITDITHNTKLQ